MSFIPLSKVNRGGVSLAPPWSKRLFKLGTIANPPGVIPAALRPFIATGMNPNLARAQAVVQANTVNSPEVRAKNRAKAQKYRGTRKRAV